LFEGGFSTGHGYLREPNDIATYTALACIAIQSNQNDQHGGQSVPNFDYCMAPGVAKTFKKLYMENFHKAAILLDDKYMLTLEQTKNLFSEIEKAGHGVPAIDMTEEFEKGLSAAFEHRFDKKNYAKIKKFAYETALTETDRRTYQAMEALVHNLNTMHSRAGAQTPFSSINYGTDTSSEGRMAIKNVLLATEAGLGEGETAIFPIHIFKVKEGINYNPGDPNYDLFKLACRVSSKRLFPNFSFIDAPFNLQYYKPGHPETEVSYMGCRTRVLGNHYDPTKEITYGRGNLSFTSINLPRMQDFLMT
jgi:ribonucleoside-triphosphate reductase